MVQVLVLKFFVKSSLFERARLRIVRFPARFPRSVDGIECVVFEAFHSIGLNDWMSHLASFRAIEQYFVRTISKPEKIRRREYLSTKAKLSNAFRKEYDFSFSRALAVP